MTEEEKEREDQIKAGGEGRMARGHFVLKRGAGQ
jgi:hypothetical protein